MLQHMFGLIDDPSELHEEIDGFNYMTFLDIEVPKTFSCREEKEYYDALRKKQLSFYDGYFKNPNKLSARIMKYLAWKRDNELNPTRRFFYHFIGEHVMITPFHFMNKKPYEYYAPPKKGFAGMVGEQYTNIQTSRFFAEYFFRPIAWILLIAYFAKIAGCY